MCMCCCPLCSFPHDFGSYRLYSIGMCMRWPTVRLSTVRSPAQTLSRTPAACLPPLADGCCGSRGKTKPVTKTNAPWHFRLPACSRLRQIMRRRRRRRLILTYARQAPRPTPAPKQPEAPPGAHRAARDFRRKRVPLANFEPDFMPPAVA